MFGSVDGGGGGLVSKSCVTLVTLWTATSSSLFIVHLKAGGKGDDRR